MIAQLQGARGDLPPIVNPACTRSSTGVGALTSGAQASTSSSRYACMDWVSKITIKRLKLLARQFQLTNEVHQSRPDKRPHLPPPGMMAFSEPIKRRGISLPFHSFVEAVLQHFNVAPFQFTLNSFCIMVAFFIALMEAGIGEPNVDEFTFAYGIKMLTKHEGFWYMTKRDTNMNVITGLPNNMGHWKYHYFFYPSECLGEFRVACE